MKTKSGKQINVPTTKIKRINEYNKVTRAEFQK